MDWIKTLQKPDYWLVGLSSSLVVLHLTLVDKSQNENLFSLSFLIWLTLASLIWDRRKTLNLESDLFSTILGTILIVLMLIRNLATTDTSLRLLPFIAGIGVLLIASGTKSLKSYWKEIILLSLLLVYKFVANLLNAIDLPLLTAKASTLFLWAIGFDVYRQGVIIALPEGRVEVYGACSGVESIILMLCVSTLFMFLIPISHLQKIICVVLAVSIGFLVNAGRVALLAFLVNARSSKDFEYWHGSDGSLSFAIVSVLIFGIYCWFAYVRKFGPSTESGDP